MSRLPRLASKYSFQYVLQQDRHGFIMPDASIAHASLAYSWNNQLYLLEVRGDRYDALQFVQVATWTCANNISAIVWISAEVTSFSQRPHRLILQLVLVLSSDERAYFLEVPSLRLLEASTLKEWRLVFQDRFGKYWTSTRVAQRPDSFSQSLLCYKGRLVALGADNIFIGNVLPWVERLDYIEQNVSIVDAIATTVQIYQDQSAVAVMGLAASKTARRQQLREYALKLLKRYVDSELEMHPNLSSLDDDYALQIMRDLVPFCMDTCLVLDAMDDLLSTLYDKFSSWRPIYLDALTTYILDGRITKLTPVVMHDFVAHCREDPRSYDRLEQCILHLDPQSFDIHQMVTTCRSLELYNALIYVYNHSLHDFISPVIDLLKEIEKDIGVFEQDIQKHRTQTDYKLFVYLAFVLTGKSFPSGALEESVAKKARRDIYAFLFSESHIPGIEIGSASQYPYLKLFLRFDAREFFKVLSLAFHDAFLNGEEWRRDGSGKTFRTLQGQTILLDRQYVVDLLLKVMTKSDPPYPDDQMLFLYSFIARNMKRHSDITLADNNVSMILQELSKPVQREPAFRDECQVAIQSLMDYYHPTVDEEDELVVRFEKAGYWRLCEDIYRRQRRYGKVVECLVMAEEGDNLELYQKMSALLEQETSRLSAADREDIRRVVHISTNLLVPVNPKAFSMILLECYPGDIPAILENITDRRLQFHLLHQIVGCLSEEILAQFAPDHTAMTTELHESFIELMCEFDAPHVHQYLQTTKFSYRMDTVLRMTERHSLLDATVWLLEQSGQPMKALEIIITTCQKNADAFLRSMEQVSERYRSEPAVHFTLTMEERGNLKSFSHRLAGFLRMAIKLCQQCSKKPNCPEAESLWLRLLDFGIELQHRRAAIMPAIPHTPVSAATKLWSFSVINNPSGLDDNCPSELLIQHLLEAIRSHLNTILDSMMGNVSNLPTVLHRLLQSPQVGRKAFSELRDVFSVILSTHNEEMNILRTCDRIMHFDNSTAEYRWRRLNKRSYRKEEDRWLCEGCGGKIFGLNYSETEPGDELSRVIFFRCGHMYHGSCLYFSSSVRGCAVCLEETELDEKFADLQTKGKGKVSLCASG